MPAYEVVVDVMLKPEILDPAGQAVSNALPSLGLPVATSLRIGKHVELSLGERDPDAVDRHLRALARRRGDSCLPSFTGLGLGRLGVIREVERRLSVAEVLPQGCLGRRGVRVGADPS